MSARRRACLYVSADRADLAELAHAAAPEMMLVDLEDAVSPERKGPAREIAAQFLASAPACEVLIRVNALGSEHIAADLRLCGGRPDAIVVPMLRHPDDVRAADRLIGEAESAGGIPPGSIGLLCMLETPRAVIKALDLLEASPRVAGAIFGPNDFIAATGARSIGPHGFEYHADVEVAHALVVSACAAAGVPSLTPVLTRLDDFAALEAEAARAYAHGYHGVIVVDPLQLPALRRASLPHPGAVAFARGIVSAFETGEAEARSSYDGWFVYEGPFLTMARELLEAAGADDA